MTQYVSLCDMALLSGAIAWRPALIGADDLIPSRTSFRGVRITLKGLILPPYRAYEGGRESFSRVYG